MASSRALRWKKSLAAAARRVRGRLIATGRIPAQATAASVADTDHGEWAKARQTAGELAVDSRLDRALVPIG